MGLWAGIKHALNSTLGTAEFNSLDRLIHSFIVGSKRFISSDDILATIYYGDEVDDRTFTCKFTPKVPGVVKILVYGRMSSSSYNGNFSIIEDGTTIQHITFNGTSWVEKSATVNIKPGSTYTFATPDRLYIEGAYICGNVTDLNYFDFIENE